MGATNHAVHFRLNILISWYLLLICSSYHMIITTRLRINNIAHGPFGGNALHRSNNMYRWFCFWIHIFISPKFWKQWRTVNSPDYLLIFKQNKSELNVHPEIFGSTWLEPNYYKLTELKKHAWQTSRFAINTKLSTNMICWFVDTTFTNI